MGAHHLIDAGVRLADPSFGAFDYRVELGHDARDGEGLFGRRGHTRPFTCRDIVGDAAHLELSLTEHQGLDHGRADIAGQKRQNIGSANGLTESFSLLGEHHVKGGAIDFGPFEQGPSIGVGIGRIDGADKVQRKATLGLIPIKGLEGRGGENTAEVPNYRFDHGLALP